MLYGCGLIIIISSLAGQNQGGKKKYSGGLLISTSATIGALLLVALMCFWGCFLYKKFGKNGSNSIAMDVSGGNVLNLSYLSKLFFNWINF
jgi:hypothetical protein